MRRDVVIPSLTGVVSFALGVGGGWLLKSYLDKRKSSEVESEVEDLKEEVTQLHFQFLEAKDEMNAVANTAILVLNEVKNEGKTLLERTAEELRSMHNHPTNGNEDVATRVSIFQDQDDEWDYAVEVPTRGTERPYICHVDEFYENEGDYTQATLTYYEGDNILCDDQDVPVYNPEKIVGVLRFGHGSQDPNICYVRNPKLEAQFEILREHGHFQTEVLGHHIEEEYEEKDIKHSSLHKFREA